jgi:RNA polymerase sigma-70 factor (ECF subfamily)
MPSRDRFLELLRPHQADLERYCRASVHQQDEVADVLQDALLRALRDFGRFAEGTSFRAFVFRYVVHEALNRNRRIRRRAQREVPLEPEPQDVTRDLEAEARHELLLASPQRALDECGDQVRSAFMALAPLERSAFLLMSLGGFRAREVGELLGAPVGTVLSSVFRARRRLRERLAMVARERGLLSESDR